MPSVTAVETTRRNAPCRERTASAKNGSSKRLTSAGSRSNAVLMSPKKAERMMQPPRQVNAMPPKFSDQPRACAALRISW